MSEQPFREEIHYAELFRRLQIMHAALKTIAEGDGCYGAQASEYKHMARGALLMCEMKKQETDK